MYQLLWMLLTVVSLEAKQVYHHTFYETPLTEKDLIQQERDNTTFWCSIGVDLPCDPNEGRRLDGSCNNLEHPTIGAQHTPFIRLLPPVFGDGFGPKPTESGAPATPPRRIRTTLLSDGIRPDPYFTQLATHFFVFAAADVTSIQDTVNYLVWKPYCCLPQGKTDSQCAPIEVPNDDPIYRFSDIRCLNQTKPITYQYEGCLKSGTAPERINSALPLFDLSPVYGSNLRNSLEKGRLYKDGLLKYELENGKVFPPSISSPNACVQNEPPRETKCFRTPDEGMNSLLGLNIATIWFWRNHNRIASALAHLNPSWDDDKTFNTAKDINIATYMQIFYYEFLQLLLGWNNLKRDSVVLESLGFRDKYNPNVLPRITLEFPYILRWAHLMLEGRLKMYDEEGNYLKQVPIVNMTFRSGFLMTDNNIEQLTQGSFRQACAKLDYTIDPDISEMVFGSMQRAADLATSDLNKGRHSGFPPYVKYVEHCTNKTINDFEDLAEFIDSDKLELLRDLYQHVKDIDLLAGTWVEKPVRDGLVPPTFYCIVVDQLIRSMVSDRHWYERPNRPHAFTTEQLSEIRKASISRILCDVGDKVTRIQRRGFERVGLKNRMVNCTEIEEIDLRAWKVDSCK